MPLLTQRILRGLKPAALHPGRPPARREQPARIILGVRAGSRPSSKPPVRIYLGTERGQFRAERIFIWSVEKHRDPSRIYEIHLLRDLKGFRRRFWLTGFTNYRFAIPGFAGNEGRAIYNDADQIYLKDPALLFDTAMDQAGFLSINDRDTSVMLIDCKRMSQVWNAHDVRRLSRKALEARARKARLWGTLDAGWNARDSEYDSERSHLVHFTTLHTQPWRPFPDELVYFDNPTDPLWTDLERDADQAGFLPLTASRPSEDWSQAAAALPSAEWRSLLVPEAPAERAEQRTVDDLLERVPDQDLPWVLERLFSTSNRLAVKVREPLAHGGGRTRRSLWYWQQQLNAASRLHPQVPWELQHRAPWSRTRRFFGGPVEQGAIHVLVHRKPGHNNQARAIADRLAALSQRPVIEVPISTSEPAFFVQRLLGLSGLKAAVPAKSGIVIAGGWLPCRIARQMQRRNPRLRLILSGRKAGPAEAMGSVLVQCRHFGLPPHPFRLTTTLPLNNGYTAAHDSDAALSEQHWADWLSAGRTMAVLVGGDSRSHRLCAESATELARQLSEAARFHQARLLVVTGRRSLGILDALEQALSDHDLLYRWRADDRHNPYALALARADILIVTGESESMLADAASRGRGFLIWPTARRRPGAWQRLSAELAERAARPRFNRRGSIRPQQGQTYLCARALERNWILPPRQIEKLHQSLYSLGLAAPFGQPQPTAFTPFPDELTASARAAAEQLGIPLDDPALNRPETLSSHDRNPEHP